MGGEGGTNEGEVAFVLGSVQGIPLDREVGRGRRGACEQAEEKHGGFDPEHSGRFVRSV